MTSPLLRTENDLDTRSLAFVNLSAEGDEQRFDVGKDDGCGGRRGEDGAKGLAMLGVHDGLIAIYAITGKAA